MIQIFDESGEVPRPSGGTSRIPVFSTFSERTSISGLAMAVPYQILKFDLNGNLLLYSWVQFGRMPGCLWGPHQTNVDRAGNLYVA